MTLLQRIELHGVIKGNGIICSCANCDSSTVSFSSM